MNAEPAPAGTRARNWKALAAELLVHALTLGRLFLALGFPWVPPRWWVAAVVAGALSDLLDGWVSRRAGVHSLTGQILDPIADKLFMASVVLTLWWSDVLSLWQAPLVLFRDLAVAAVSAAAVFRSGWGAMKRMPPSLLGKLATAGQFVFLVALLYDRGWGTWLPTPAFVVAAALSLAAGVGYVRKALDAGRSAATV